VSGIYERDRRLLEFLEQRGIRPGAKVHVVGRNYDNTLTLTTGSGKVSLGVSAAERVWVKTANGKSSHNPKAIGLPHSPQSAIHKVINHSLCLMYTYANLSVGGVVYCSFCACVDE